MIITWCFCSGKHFNTCHRVKWRQHFRKKESQPLLNLGDFHEEICTCPKIKIIFCGYSCPINTQFWNLQIASTARDIEIPNSCTADAPFFTQVAPLIPIVLSPEFSDSKNLIEVASWEYASSIETGISPFSKRSNGSALTEPLILLNSTPSLIEYPFKIERKTKGEKPVETKSGQAVRSTPKNARERLPVPEIRLHHHRFHPGLP